MPVLLIPVQKPLLSKKAFKNDMRDLRTDANGSEATWQLVTSMC